MCQPVICILSIQNDEQIIYIFHNGIAVILQNKLDSCLPSKFLPHKKIKIQIIISRNIGY